MARVDSEQAISELVGRDSSARFGFGFGFGFGFVFTDVPDGVQLSSATVHGLQGDGDHGAAAAVLVNAGSELVVTNSIFTESSHDGVVSHADNLDVAVRIFWSNIWNIQDRRVVNATVSDETMLDANPRYTNPGAGDFTLREGPVGDGGSPCIDAGDGAADCSQEPVGEDGRCRIDMGSHGNTPRARAR